MMHQGLTGEDCSAELLKPLPPSTPRRALKAVVVSGLDPCCSGRLVPRLHFGCDTAPRVAAPAAANAAHPQATVPPPQQPAPTSNLRLLEFTLLKKRSSYMGINR